MTTYTDNLVCSTRFEEEEEDEFPFALEGLDMAVVHYLRTMREQNVDLTRQLNALIKHETLIWEENIELSTKNTDLSQIHSSLLLDNEKLVKSRDNLEAQVIRLSELNESLERKCAQVTEENRQQIRELTTCQESAKSLEEKNYVMNEILDDLMSACNCLYDNLQSLLNDSMKIDHPPNNSSPPKPKFHQIMEIIRSPSTFNFGDKANCSSVVKVTTPDRMIEQEDSNNKKNKNKNKDKLRSCGMSPIFTQKLEELKKYKEFTSINVLSLKLKACKEISSVLHKQTRLAQ